MTALRLDDLRQHSDILRLRARATGNSLRQLAARGAIPGIEPGFGGVSLISL